MTYYARLKTGGGNSANFPSEANSKPPGRTWKNTEFAIDGKRISTSIGKTRIQSLSV
jgi:hypothetical protein